MQAPIPAELAARLDAALQPTIPMQQSEASNLLNPHFWREWIRFLGSYKRHSPLLFEYLAYGRDAGEFHQQKFLERKVARLESWIDEAKGDFQKSKTSFFWRCRILNRAERPKHWRAFESSVSNARKQSLRSKESIFHPNVSELDVLQGLWVAMASHFDLFKQKKMRFVVVDYETLIGFSNGIDATFVRYDIDYTAVHAHAYPVSQSEAMKHDQLKLSTHSLRYRLKLSRT